MLVQSPVHRISRWPIPGYLDGSLLTGQRAVVRQIGPEHVAVLVNSKDLSDCVAAVVGYSELWGSASFVFVPVEPGSDGLAPAWEAVLRSGRLDSFSPGSVIESDPAGRLAGLGQGPGGFSETLWSVLAAQPDLTDSFPLTLALPSQDDPWFVSYLAAFGDCQWPSSSPHWRPRISPLVAIISPRWWRRISPPTD